MAEIRKELNTADDPFITNRVQVAEANSFLMKRVTLGAFVNMTILSVVSPFLSGFCGAEPLYIISAALTGLFLIFCSTRLDRYPKAVAPLFYILLACLCAYSVALSCFYYPDIHGVTIVGMLALTPMVILDRPWRVNLIFTLIFFASCVFAFLCKPLALAVDDCTACGAFLVFGMLIGSYMRKTRMDAIVQQYRTEYQRDYDALTTLPNRRLLFDTLGRIDSGDGETPINGIFMIDVDDFKLYNDVYGHQAGDLCLKRLGALFAEFSQQHDVTVYRYGGEEFLGLWRGDDEARLGSLSRLLVETVRLSDKSEQAVTVSVGYALKTAGVSSQRLISMADGALYEAKRLGKCRAVGYSPAGNDRGEAPTASFRQRQ